jgi:hypothetical protein
MQLLQQKEAIGIPSIPKDHEGKSNACTLERKSYFKRITQTRTPDLGFV